MFLRCKKNTCKIDLLRVKSFSPYILITERDADARPAFKESLPTSLVCTETSENRRIHAVVRSQQLPCSVRTFHLLRPFRERGFTFDKVHSVPSRQHEANDNDGAERTDITRTSNKPLSFHPSKESNNIGTEKRENSGSATGDRTQSLW